MAAAVVGEEDRGRHHLHPHPCLILKLELSADETVEGISGGTVARHQHHVHDNLLLLQSIHRR